MSSAPESILDADDEAWQLETWTWLFRNMGGESDFRARDLVLFTPNRFPSLKGTKTANPRWLLDDVKRITGIVAPKVVAWEDKDDEGFAPDETVISYTPDDLQEPWPLILRFAMTLAQTRLAECSEARPGGDAMADCVCELFTAYLGFGLFGADCAIKRTYVPGWKSGRKLVEDKNTALREPDWVFALGVFLQLKGGASEPLLPYLNADLEAPLRQTLRYLKAKPELTNRLYRG
jgi:hypothetical protein